MTYHAPYLHRRGFSFAFRIAVPPDLRAIVGSREITKALPSVNKVQAVPLALEYAAFAKRLFCNIRTAMEDENEEQRNPIDFDKLKQTVQMVKLRIQLSDLKDKHRHDLTEQRLEHLREKNELQQTIIGKVKQAKVAVDLRQAKLTATNEALQSVVAGFQHSPLPSHVSTSNSPASGPAPMLYEVIDDYIDGLRKAQKPATLQKANVALTMLRNFLANVPVNHLRQAQFIDFFEKLHRLPDNWFLLCRHGKVTVQQLVELEHAKTLGPQSIEVNYKKYILGFLNFAVSKYSDQGFPARLALTVKDVKYVGDRVKGEDKQRPFTLPELKRLFEGEEMKAFAGNPEQSSCFWLPHVGLFTGARGNEICQLNPQTDILQDETGTHYFLITEDTESSPDVIKSVKGKKGKRTRQVPVHQRLIDLGFVNYASQAKASGRKLMFPDWEPVDGRAGIKAMQWFSRLLSDTGLRDETPGACVLGMHAFRHTLITYGAKTKPMPLNLSCITGHEQGDTASEIEATGAFRGYVGLSLTAAIREKAELLNRLDYGISFFKPTSA